MNGKSKYKNHTNIEFTHWLVGLSCFTFIAPSIYIYNNLDILCEKSYYDCLFWKFEIPWFSSVAILSFLNDYYHHYLTKNNFISKFLIYLSFYDRWIATIACIRMGFKQFFLAFILPYELIVLDFIVAVLAVLTFKKSIYFFDSTNDLRSTIYRFRFYHIIWHILAALCGTLNIHHEITYKYKYPSINSF